MKNNSLRYTILLALTILITSLLTPIPKSHAGSASATATLLALSHSRSHQNNEITREELVCIALILGAFGIGIFVLGQISIRSGTRF